MIQIVEPNRAQGFEIKWNKIFLKKTRLAACRNYSELQTRFYDVEQITFETLESRVSYCIVDLFEQAHLTE